MPRPEVHRIPRKQQPDMSPFMALGWLPQPATRPLSTSAQVQATKKAKKAAKQSRKRNRQ